MKYLILLVASFLISSLCQGQTYSKIYELQEFKDNLMVDLEVYNDVFHVGVSHFCDPDTTDNRVIDCLGYYEFNLVGELDYQILYDTFFSIGENSLLISEKNKIISTLGHSFGNGVPFTLIDLKTNVIRQVQTTNMDDKVFPIGVHELYSNLYLNSVKGSENESKKISSIQKLDNDYNIVWSTDYARGGVNNDCQSFQATADGNLIFIHDYNDGPGAGGESGIEIVKLDTNGIVIDTLNLADSDINGGANPTLLSASDGSLYTATDNALRDDDFSVNLFQGVINKISPDMNSFIWSTVLPVKSFFNGRSYIVNEIIEAHNGDILAVGTAWDRSVGGHINYANLSNYNGFVVRLDAETGDILWLRVYQLPIASPLLDPVEHGAYISGLIKRVHELEDGRLVFGGTAYYDTPQKNVLIPAEKAISFVWLMTTDENGCLEGEECSENIILDGTYKPTDGFLPYISSEKDWYIAPFSGPGPGGPSSARRYTFSQDSVWENGWYYQWLEYESEEDTDPEVKGLLKESNGVVFIKTGPGLQEEKILYDFTLIVGDTVDYLSDMGDLHIVTEVDTIMYEDEVPRKRIRLECLENFQGPLYWIEGMGGNAFTRYGICVPDDLEAQLYCYFEDGEKLYQIPWLDLDDDCRLITAVEDLSQSTLRLLPNPAFDKVTITYPVTSYEIWSATGRLLLEYSGSETEQIDISILAAGLYFIYMEKPDGSRWTDKLVVGR